MDNKYPVVNYWMGRPISELTSEEKDEVINFLADELQRQRQMARETMQYLFGELRHV